MNKGQQCRTFKKDSKLLHNIFFHKQSFRRCPEIPCRYRVCLLLSPCPMEGTTLSTNQWTSCVAQTCRDPFRLSVPQRSSTARRELLDMTRRIAWRWKHDPCRTFADRTNPQCKCNEMRHYSQTITISPIVRSIASLFQSGPGTLNILIVFKFVMLKFSLLLIPTLTCMHSYALHYHG